MKATDLMIGDWVGRVFDDKRIIEDYRQVDWIRTGEIGMRYRKVWSIGCIEPIPLTPEILEKNGFERSVLIPSKFYRNIDNERLIFCPHSSCYDLGYVHWNESNDADIMHRLEVQQPIMYIHQMQHALRLCGLDELADNFKV